MYYNASKPSDVRTILLLKILYNIEYKYVVVNTHILHRKV